MREPGPARTFFASSKKRPRWPERANAVDAIYQLREREEARLLEVARERRVQPRDHRVAGLGRLRDKPLLGEGPRLESYSVDTGTSAASSRTRRAVP